MFSAFRTRNNPSLSRDAGAILYVRRQTVGSRNVRALEFRSPGRRVTIIAVRHDTSPLPFRIQQRAGETARVYCTAENRAF